MAEVRSGEIGAGSVALRLSHRAGNPAAPSTVSINAES